MWKKDFVKLGDISITPQIIHVMVQVTSDSSP